MSYFLRPLARDEDDPSATPSCRSSLSSPTRPCPSSSLSRLLRHSARLPPGGHLMQLPSAGAEGNAASPSSSPTPLSLLPALSLAAAPSPFAVAAIARAICIQYSHHLSTESPPEWPAADERTRREREREEAAPSGSQLVSMGLKCMFSVLWKLNKKDPSLCEQALLSLRQMLEALPPEALLAEGRPAVDEMVQQLRALRKEGPSPICSLSSSCLSALSIGCGQPDRLLETAAVFLTEEPHHSTSSSSPTLVQMPENLHRVATIVQRRVYHEGAEGKSADFCLLPLPSHRRLCSLDCSRLPSDSSPDSPDDGERRLWGAIASDGAFVYLLNHFGAYKLGTGLGETVSGRLYASNTMIRASRNCALFFCNSSLYLRRGQSSRVWVLDTDTLREIGEILLPTECGNTAIFSDGQTFYQAAVDGNSTLTVTPLTDSFVPSSDAASKKRYRLTDTAYSVYGDQQSVGATPRGAIGSMPREMQNSAADLVFGRDVVFLLERQGRVMYSGNATRHGLADTAGTWQEVNISEPVVQLAVSTDALLLRTGCGHLWTTRREEEKRGRVRRVHTHGRKKVICVAANAACVCYVTENGKVYATGRHAWRTHEETDQVAGLDGVHIVKVCVGKTHAAAVSRHGHLYTWGLNNLHQCGREESLQPPPSAPGHTPLQQCPPTEHLWVKDIPTVCVRCGHCSARGATCTRTQGKRAGEACCCGEGEASCLRCGVCRDCASAPAIDRPTRSQLEPARVMLSDVKVASVACGNFHTVLLTADRQVFSFGSNCHGQLGVGDTSSHPGVMKVLLPASAQIVQVAAGANHSILRAADGTVYTFGAHKGGQLARLGSELQWHCSPHPIREFGANGKVAVWIGAVGDCSIVHSNTALFSNEDLCDSACVASETTLLLLPRQVGRDYLAVRRAGRPDLHVHHMGASGLYVSWFLEPSYNVLWSYSAAEMRVQAFLPRGPSLSDPSSPLSLLATTELLLPTGETRLSPHGTAISLLSVCYGLTAIARGHGGEKDLLATTPPAMTDSRTLPSEQQYQTVARFEGHGGGWGYSAHSVEAIQFRCDRDIRLLGVGLYGGRGEYSAKLKLFRVVGGDGDELYAELLAETDETLYECAAREAAALLLGRPITIRAGVWHVLSAKISGPSSDCGAGGRSSVKVDEVTFEFRASAVSNNGTDVSVGQLPELHFHVERDESPQEEGVGAGSEELRLLRSPRLLYPTSHLIPQLLIILRWAVERSFEPGRSEVAAWQRERASLVAIIAMRMLRWHIPLLYTKQQGVEEPNKEIADCMVSLRDILDQLYGLADEMADTQDPCQPLLLDESVFLHAEAGRVLLGSRCLVLARLSLHMSTPARDWTLLATLHTLAQADQVLSLIVSTGRPRTEPYPRTFDALQAKHPLDSARISQLASFHNICRLLFDVAFGQPTVETMAHSSLSLPSLARSLLAQIVRELVTPKRQLGEKICRTASRFRRRGSVAGWDMSTGASDAVAVSVDAPGVLLQGVCVYLSDSPGPQHFVCEVYAERAGGSDWELLDRSSHSVIDPSDIGQLRFTRAVRMRPGRRYAVRVNQPGSRERTFGGENGHASLRLHSGHRLLVTSCQLSENGTGVSRGQLPHFLYSVDEGETAEEGDQEQTASYLLTLLRMLASKISDCLANDEGVAQARKLVSSIAGHVMMFIERRPDKALEVVSTLDQLLPMVSSVNGTSKSREASGEASRSCSISSPSLVQTVAESPHPYKSNYVHSVVAGFHPSISFISLRFDAACQTASADDTLWVYCGVDRQCYVPVAKFSGCSGWPSHELLLPGNSLWLQLETGPAVDGAADEQLYGFRCTLTGYPSPPSDAAPCAALEQELVWISAAACRLLVQLPSDPAAVADIRMAEEETRELLDKHGALLRKGVALSHPPTLGELLTRDIPPPPVTPELRFLREFMAASCSSMAGGLARWLPTGPIVDPSQCQLQLSDELCVGRRTTIRLLVRDQHARSAQCADMNVEITVRMGGMAGLTPVSGAPSGGTPGASPTDSRLASQFQSCTLPSLHLIQQNPYQPVYMNKARYMSVGMMNAYQGYSYEELRLGFYRDAVLKDTVKMSAKDASTFTGDWVPRQAGAFRIECRVDGFQIGQSYSVEVSENAEDVAPEGKRRHRVAQLSRARLSTLSPYSSYSALRIRSSPSLSAPAVGLLPRGAALSWLETIENADGRWLRLTDETTALHGDSQSACQGWCLQYHRHLKRKLVDIGEAEETDEGGSNPASTNSNTVRQRAFENSCTQSVLVETEEMYVLSDGDRVELFSRPALDAVIHGEILEGRRELATDGWLQNRQGVWIRLAHSHRYILAEDTMGRSSVHSQLRGDNGNDEEGEARIARARPASSSRALRPSVVDSCRCVFAALLWHEHLVKDAMAAASYLHFHQHLQGLWQASALSPAVVPPQPPQPLQPLVKLWREVCVAVETATEQHLIMPSPPAVRREREEKSSPSQQACSSQAVQCELCEERPRGAITQHMRAGHPGCGKDSRGYGYNSAGRFTTGWVGNCGDGGRGGSSWYLMCVTCRVAYLKQTPSGHQQERTRRWREFRLTATTADQRPELVLRQNALFLLELNPAVDGFQSKSSSANTSGWTINVFPAGGGGSTTAQSRCSQFSPQWSGAADKLSTTWQPPRALTDSSLSQHQVHLSDPGPKRRRDSTDREEEAVLQSPSVHLKSLASLSSSVSGPAGVMKRPVMQFVIEHHDLSRVRSAARLAVRRAVSFSHALRVWNWLMRMVSTENSVSDIILQYLSTLTTFTPLLEQRGAAPVPLLPHPWTVCVLAGPLATQMVHQLHSLLHTLAVIVQSQGVDSGLRSLCFRAWTIQLTFFEQELLSLTCSMLAAVGNVLADPAGDRFLLEDSAGHGSLHGASDMRRSAASSQVDVKEMDDVTSMCKIEASSRQAMVVCLTDGSSETFWESGEEDKSRTRSLSIRVEAGDSTGALLTVYIDNARDEAARVNQITFKTAQHDGGKLELHKQLVDQQFVGWIRCCVAGVTKVQVLLKGAGVSCRVRQVCLLGFSSSPLHRPNIRPSPSHQLLFSAGQRDAFALFQAISAQAFSPSFSSEQHGPLRQRVLDLLFSRVQLQPLQQHVASQMVSALTREVISLRDQGKRNYSYACGLLGMLTGIGASRKGLEVFSTRNQLLITLSELLLFAPQVVQVQVLDAMEGLFKHVPPCSGDVGPLAENLLACVAKAVSLQVRQRASHSVTQATVASSMLTAPPSWRVDRPMGSDVARATQRLLDDVCSGTFSPEWRDAMRCEVAGAIPRLIRLSTESGLFGSDLASIRSSTNSHASILNSRRFWLGVAALSVLRDKQWLDADCEWTAMQNAREDEPEPMCENHDDGRTRAQIYCNVCETALCRDCFTIMHLKKKNRDHSTVLLASASSCPQVEVHEGCARLRVNNILVLLHGSALNGLLQLSTDAMFPSSSSIDRTSSIGVLPLSGVVQRCRFCDNQLPAETVDPVCSHEECRKLLATACTKTLPCSHACGGVRDEVQCPPCMQCPVEGSGQDGDDVCVVCFTDRLGAAPVIRLTACQHAFHAHCLRTVLEKRWQGPRILFRFMNCPLCNIEITHPSLNDLLSPLRALREDVSSKARLRLEYDGLLDCPAVKDPGSEYHGNPSQYAMDRYMYVMCAKCGKAYFGGESRCQMALDSSQYNPEELICGGCSDVAGGQVCGRHGVDFLEYKCRFCCSIAVYFCFGTTHFCAGCHDDFQRLVCVPKQQLTKCPAGPRSTRLEGPCPIGGNHPPTGEEHALGCGQCRNLSTF